MEEKYLSNKEIFFNNLKDSNFFKISGKLMHFFVKSQDIVLDKYGGEITVWFGFMDDKNISKDDEYAKYKHTFFKVNDWGLIKVDMYCEYNQLTKERIITHYKSVIPFRTISDIILDDDLTLTIHTNKNIKIPLHDMIYLLAKKTEVKIEPFHRRLIDKYEKFCIREYNKNQFSKADEIKKFKELLDNETITQDEFDSFKKNLLNN